MEILHASVLQHKHKFQIKTIVTTLTCYNKGKSKGKMASSKWIASKILDEVNANLDVSSLVLKNTLDKKYVLLYQRIWWGKVKTEEIIYGSISNCYVRILDLKAELLKRNPSRTICFELDECNCFSSFFFCFKVLRGSYMVVGR